MKSLSRLEINSFDQHIHTLNLIRFPESTFDKSLRAWDAADEYIIASVVEKFKDQSPENIVIINDSFGALTCAFAMLYPQAKICAYTDSFMSEKGLQHNLVKNDISDANVSHLNSLDIEDIVEHSADAIILKIPRTHAFLDYILLNISKLISVKQSYFVAGAMVKMVTSAVLKNFDKYFSDTKTSLARKKSRLIFAETTIKLSNQSKQNTLKIVEDPNVPVTLRNYPNVFCRDHIDIGARLLLEHLPKLKAGETIIDLGSGNGILGLSIIDSYITQNTNECAKHNAQQPPKVLFVDESYMAIASAKASLNNDYSELAEFRVDHCLSDFLQDDNNHASANVVICNPPFHQQNTILDDIAWQMFSDAKLALKIGGELRIVGNRHLEHRTKLVKIFGGCRVIATNAKFTVLSAIKN